MKLKLNFSNRQEVLQTIQEQGFCIIDEKFLSNNFQLNPIDFQYFEKYWDDLHEDKYLKDLGQYRFRRHSSYKVDGEKTTLMPHRAHWQSLDYNALHGGIQRMFEPIESDLNDSPSWLNLISGIGSLFGASLNSNNWFVEAHQFRINTMGGIGRPTPEGAHRDGVDYVAVILVKRNFIKGGETRIFELDGEKGLRFTLDKPWSVLLIDDHKMIHETTPIQDDGGSGYRDTLVLTYRRLGFQEPIVVD